MIEIESISKRSRTKDIFIRSVFIVTLVIVLSFGAWGGIMTVRYLPDTTARIWSNVSGNLSTAVIELTSRFSPSPSEASLNNNDSSISEQESDSLSLHDENPNDQGIVFSSDNTLLSNSDDISSNTQNTSTAIGDTDREAHAQGEQTVITVPLDETPVAPGANGVPDLSVSIVAVGIIDPATNVFVEQSTMKTTDRGAVAFHVTNTGTENIVAGWIFETTLPTSPAHVFSSDPQQALAPGDRIEFTLGFDQVAANADGNAVVTIVIDPDNILTEVSKDNNTTQATIAVKN